MSKLLERFINYVKIDTTSVEDSEVIPSSEGQWELAKFLEAEMKALAMEPFLPQKALSMYLQ